MDEIRVSLLPAVDEEKKETANQSISSPANHLQVRHCSSNPSSKVKAVLLIFQITNGGLVKTAIKNTRCHTLITRRKPGRPPSTTTNHHHHPSVPLVFPAPVQWFRSSFVHTWNSCFHPIDPMTWLTAMTRELGSLTPRSLASLKMRRKHCLSSVLPPEGRTAAIHLRLPFPGSPGLFALYVVFDLLSLQTSKPQHCWSFQGGNLSF